MNEDTYLEHAGVSVRGAAQVVGLGLLPLIHLVIRLGRQRYMSLSVGAKA